MKTSILILVLALALKAGAQSMPGKLVETTIAGTNALVWQPVNASKEATLFVHGLGEGGTAIANLYRNGPFQFIKAGTLKPTQWYFALQGPASSWLNSSAINRWIDSLIKRYSVDSFNLTGLSMGARAIFKTIQNGKHTGRIKNVVAMSLDNDENPWLTLPYKNIRLLSLMGNKDLSHGHVRLKAFTESLAALGYTAKYENYAGGHDGWSSLYAPSNPALYAWLNPVKDTIVIPPPIPDPGPKPPTTGRRLLYSIEFYSDSTYQIR